MNYETLNECQKRAVIQLSSFLAMPSQKHMIIEGAGGVGKGYLLRYLHDNWNEVVTRASVFTTESIPAPEFTATTNEAVYQLGIDSASTIYSYAALRPWGNTVRSYRAPTSDKRVVFIDEASYIDEKTFKLIEFQLPKHKFVWVLDPYQLSPVGSELPYVHTQGFKSVELRTIERCQGMLQKLVQELREAVKNQEGVNFRAYHCEDIQVVDTQTFHQMIVERFREDPINSKVVMFKNKSADLYNKAINEHALGNPPFPFAGANAIVNSYNEIYNHKAGTRLVIDRIHKTGLDTEVALETSIGSLLTPVDKTNLRDHPHYIDIALPYASTTHKAQGSTIDTVFVDAKDIFSTWDAEMRRRLIYVAISRASKKVVICL